MKKTFNEIPISKLESVDTKKFERQIQKIHANQDILITSSIAIALQHPFIKKTLQPSSLPNFSYLKINNSKYYFEVVDFKFAHTVKLLPMSTQEFKDKVKNAISSLLREL